MHDAHKARNRQRGKQGDEDLRGIGLRGNLMALEAFEHGEEQRLNDRQLRPRSGPRGTLRGQRTAPAQRQQKKRRTKRSQQCDGKFQRGKRVGVRGIGLRAARQSVDERVPKKRGRDGRQPPERESPGHAVKFPPWPLSTLTRPLEVGIGRSASSSDRAEPLVVLFRYALRNRYRSVHQFVKKLAHRVVFAAGAANDGRSLNQGATMRRIPGLAASSILTLLVVSACGNSSNLVNPSPTPTPVVPNVASEAMIPTANAQPTAITRGQDGNYWFTESAANKIARLSPGGVAEFPVPTAGSRPFSIVTGSDGNLWFTESTASKIGKITFGGVVTEYALAAGSSPQQIIAGPDGNLWFTEAGTNRIGTITVAGVVSEFAVPTAAAGLFSITIGPDGALWFTEQTASKIGRITTAGALSEFATATANAQPYEIVLGPDGALWFTQQTGPKLGRLTSAGVASEFSLAPATSANFIVVGSDGRFYIGDPASNKIAQVTTAGTYGVIEYGIPTPNAQPGPFAVLGFDARVYFTESSGNKIAQFQYF